MHWHSLSWSTAEAKLTSSLLTFVSNLIVDRKRVILGLQSVCVHYQHIEIRSEAEKQMKEIRADITCQVVCFNPQH